MDDWSDLDAFHAVVETGSLAAAARRLNVSHPTIGRRLDALEARLSAQLIVRGASGVTLTEAGAAILDNVRRMGQEADAIHRLAAGLDTGLSGVVTVSSIEGVGTTVLPRLFAELRDDHPDITFNLDISGQAANLVRREADIAVRFGGAGAQQSLITRRIATIGMGFYAAPDYLDLKGRPAVFEELAGHDVVASGLGEDPSLFETIDGKQSQGRVSLLSLSPLGTFRGLEAGMGVGIASHWRSRARPTLERVLPEVEVKPIEVWLVAHAEVKKSARIRIVYDHLAKRFVENAQNFREGDPEISERID